MTETDELHGRLDALGKDIEASRGRLKEHDAWHDGHHLTSGELKARYLYLKSKLDAEIRDLEVHGRHVSALEASVRAWVNGLDV